MKNKRCTSNRDNRILKRIMKHCGWSQWFKSPLTWREPGHGLQLSQSMSKATANQRQPGPGLRRKMTRLLPIGPKSSFQMKVNVAFHWKSKCQSVGREWRGTEAKFLEVQCVVSTVSGDLGGHAICGCWSTVFYHPKVSTAIYRQNVYSTLHFPLMMSLMEMLL